MVKVAAVKTDSYDTQVVEQAMQDLFIHLGGIENFIKPRDKVLIKPNMLEPIEKGYSVTTHP